MAPNEKYAGLKVFRGDRRTAPTYDDGRFAVGVDPSAMIVPCGVPDGPDIPLERSAHRAQPPGSAGSRVIVIPARAAIPKIQSRQATRSTAVCGYRRPPDGDRPVQSTGNSPLGWSCAGRGLEAAVGPYPPVRTQKSARDERVEAEPTQENPPLLRKALLSVNSRLCVIRRPNPTFV